VCVRACARTVCLSSVLRFEPILDGACATSMTYMMYFDLRRLCPVPCAMLVDKGLELKRGP
jgi:hypothetical protein